MSAERARPGLEEILEGVIECSVEQFAANPAGLSARTRPVQDLGAESLDLLEWLMEIEERFGVSLPDPSEIGDQVYKQVFTRPDFTLGDMAELVHLRWGSARAGNAVENPPELVELNTAGFAQLGWTDGPVTPTRPSYEEIGQDANGRALLRRRVDGMPCVVIPGGTVTLGYAGADAGADERPVHDAKLSGFAIDLELVSTTAYCRFLNCSGVTDRDTLRKWFLLDPDDRRRVHEGPVLEAGRWRPRPGSEKWPMILVSWHGARAYARWAHCEDPTTDAGPSFLPTEAQWEYAARGRATTRWPSGDDAPAAGVLRAGRARTARTTGELALGPVHALDGLSPFGLRGALGHVWQWCADWYAPDAYSKRGELPSDPAHTAPTEVRAERGGSWVGPASLCRPSYRRGRVPRARGRCLGFRCASPR